MSLDQLRSLRRARHRPSGPVIVLIGKAPRCFGDEPNEVVIGAHPRGLDLSPLIGLSAHVFDMQDDMDLTRAVVGELEGLNVLIRGLCAHYGVAGLTPEHERSMERYRECLL